MSETITISKSVLEELITRVRVLEKAVFKKNKAFPAVDVYLKEKKAGKLRKLKAVEELFA